MLGGAGKAEASLALQRTRRVIARRVASIALSERLLPQCAGLDPAIHAAAGLDVSPLAVGIDDSDLRSGIERGGFRAEPRLLHLLRLLPQG